jgi:C1A family cysteine protease
MAKSSTVTLSKSKSTPRAKAESTPAEADTATSTVAGGRTFDALPDTIDFRDKMYVPTLVEVPQVSDLARYKSLSVPVLDQGAEGACTGFALASVVNYLGRYGKPPLPNAEEASAHMLYVMAKRYDEWPGDDYEGSSARGAMKGWHKHGVCALDLWDDKYKHVDITDKQAASALKRPLGAYFRVNHKELVAMHSAITEVGILYATGMVHAGWQAPANGTITYSPDRLGGHAFVIVGYDETGFFVQNSWGPGWGDNGIAHMSYADWLINGSDVWVARLGAPVALDKIDVGTPFSVGATKTYESYTYNELRPHVVTAGNDGLMLGTGPFGLTDDGLRSILREQMRDKVKPWATKRVMVYAHGGLVSQESALQYVANYKKATLDAEVYPLAIIWRSDAWSTIENILRDALFKRKSEGFLDAAKDFMFDRIDDTLEPIARTFGGKALWDEMKENATLCAGLVPDRPKPGEKQEPGAARKVADHLIAAAKAGEIDEVHLVGHSAGSILLAPFADYLIKHGLKVTSVSLWAPACTMQLFRDSYAPHMKPGEIEAFDLYTLDDPTEQDDNCANIYHKSLLYMVSHALEEFSRAKDPDGTAILGLARDVEGIPKSKDPLRKEGIKKLFVVNGAGPYNWFKAPSSQHSDARGHGQFDNDGETLLSTLKRITGMTKAALGGPPVLNPTAAKNIGNRQDLNRALFNPGRPRGA